MFTQWIHYNHYLELAPRLFHALTTAFFTSCSSADWPASPSPRRGRPRWWRRWPVCTSCGDVGNVGPACLWSRRRSWHWAGPEKTASVREVSLRESGNGSGSTCLLAKTRRTASRSSSSASILISSSRASFTRSRSLLSTTKIKPEGRGMHFYN